MSWWLGDSAEIENIEIWCSYKTFMFMRFQSTPEFHIAYEILSETRKQQQQYKKK